ncbi:hypothetical protein BC939DRAFT_327789 [Gamsiella multidivaricata]|uniref:uncharacterized protein n=1 Tax=Gamsiella multidivaricata TaxID=101098 RepID=UPI002220DCF1|nr:uncharacterized protein BC939DRAFT_327789 [Gamsiella multidivaricata]KAI7817541.1 hypothetical protein BC939DRAFT_327789 [Gamsiella multidivaricata]
MNGDPVLAQMPLRDALAMTNEPIHPQIQHRQTYDRSYSRSNAAQGGNRPFIDDNFSPRTTQSRNPIDRGHMNKNQGRGNHIKGNSFKRNSNESNSTISSSGIRSQNQHQQQGQQQNHQYQSSNSYRRHDFAHNNSFIHPNNSYRSNQQHSSPNRRRHSNDSSVMSSSTHHNLRNPRIAQNGAYHRSTGITMPRSLSFTPGLPHNLEYNTHGLQPSQSPGACPRVSIDGSYHPDGGYMTPHPMHQNPPAPEHPNIVYSPQVPPQAVQSNGISISLKGPYQQPPQPVYAIPWGYHPSHMAPFVSQMMPMPSPPQQATYEGQDDMEAKVQSSPSQIATNGMSAGAYDDQDGRDRLREQLEWYFSPRNLATDTYLVSKMDTDHWVPISVVADFRKVKAITDDIQEVVNALRRSCKVLVDETGTMAKAITVDRPRTTLILRELPEDATEEEISALFVEAKCPAKLITKEAVGNMWFVEFETAADALAMLNYTRGRYLRGVPIAARLKSNTVLTDIKPLSCLCPTRKTRLCCNLFLAGRSRRRVTLRMHPCLE